MKKAPVLLDEVDELIYFFVEIKKHSFVLTNATFL